MTSSESLGLTAGNWNIDPAHSTVGFSVRHMMVSKVRGTFKEFSGQIRVADEVESSSVTATIQAASVDTGNAQRDGHLRSADFFNVERNATIEFTSKEITADGGDWTVTGDLTINAVTKPAVLQVELTGVGTDGQGGQKAGFEARTDISRKEFGVDIDMPMDNGGVVVGDKISIILDIEADLTK